MSNGSDGEAAAPLNETATCTIDVVSRRSSHLACAGQSATGRLLRRCSHSRCARIVAVNADHRDGGGPNWPRCCRRWTPPVHRDAADVRPSPRRAISRVRQHPEEPSDDGENSLPPAHLTRYSTMQVTFEGLEWVHCVAAMMGKFIGIATHQGGQVPARDGCHGESDG